MKSFSPRETRRFILLVSYNYGSKLLVHASSNIDRCRLIGSHVVILTGLAAQVAIDRSFPSTPVISIYPIEMTS